MKPRKAWLHTAVRAHQAKTLDHLQRSQLAQQELLEAELSSSFTAQQLEALCQDWIIQRTATPASQSIDVAYSRFHGHLTSKAAQAEMAREACRMHVDAAVAALRQSHAIQRTLERVARQTAERHRREAGAKEREIHAEAWLLGRLANPTPYARLGNASSAVPLPRETGHNTTAKHDGVDEELWGNVAGKATRSAPLERSK